MESSKLFKAINEQTEDDLFKLLDDPECKDDLNQRDAHGKSLLHIAVEKLRSVNTFKALLNKIDFTIRDDDGNTAIDKALDDEDFPDDVEEVVKNFVHEKIISSKKEDLDKLVLKGWLDIWLKDEKDLADDKTDVKEFMEKLPKAKEQVESLHTAVKDSKWDVVKELLNQEGSLLQAADRTGLPPLHKAVVLGMTEIVENLVKEFPESLNVTDHMDRTALHHAAGRRDAGHLYKILTDAGAKDDVKDINGQTPSAINEKPDLLPGEKTYERVMAKITSPAVTCKKKKKQQKQEDDTTQTAETEEAKPSSPKPSTPASQPPPTPKPKERKGPVQMYISPDVRPNPPPETIDGRYVAENLGNALTLALAEIAECRPKDPVEYLAHWLYKYQQNTDYNNKQKALLAKIREEEKAKEVEIEVKERRKMELARLREEEERKRKAEEEEKKRKEQEELQRKAKEVALSQRPDLETVMEDKEEEETPKEKSHKDAEGQTELHKLSAQSGADLTTLLNMGFSPAERDMKNRTARDVAVEANVKENVEAIDKYIQKLLEMEEFETLEELLLAGYDKFDVVLDRLRDQTTNLPEATQTFIKDIPVYKERIEAVLKSVQNAGLRDLNQALERKKLAIAKDSMGRSLLHVAVLTNHIEAVEHLAKNFPVTLKCKDNMERTPLHYAMATSPELTAILEKHGADTFCKDAKQRLPSYYRDHKDEIDAIKGSLVPIATKSDGDTAETTEADKEEPTTEQQPDDEESTEQTQETTE